MSHEVVAHLKSVTRSSHTRAAHGPNTMVHVLFAIGALSRLAPLFDQGGRLLRQFPTEDGYLMLTIARNLAHGLGMSTADGLLPTNGTQPLATILWSACFWLVSGNKLAGVALVLLAQVGIASATAFGIYQLGVRLFADQPSARPRAALAAAAWYASPLVLPHTMNCLETGLYGLLLVATFALLLTLPARRTADLRHWAAIGLAFGAAFWARNDAILLCGATALVHLCWGLGDSALSRRQRFCELVTAGVVVAVVASPWLLFNYVRFGSVMPISGQAEALGARFAENLPGLLPALLEYILLVLPIPHALEDKLWVRLMSITAIVLFAVAVRRYGPRNARGRDALRLGLTFAALLCAFYGLYFGAGHFLSRYLFALSPLYALLWASAVHAVVDALRRRALRPAGLPFAVALALMLVVHLRAYDQGGHHQHFQVVEWVENNVPDAAWVGAIQSGTLGFFHDRTLNLDGKVNPLALEARKHDAIDRYVADSEIDYLVDWIDILAWNQHPIVANTFEVRVAHADQNLAALRRKDQYLSARMLPK